MIHSWYDSRDCVLPHPPPSSHFESAHIWSVQLKSLGPHVQTISRLQHLNLAASCSYMGYAGLVARLLKGLTFGCACCRFSAIRASTRDVKQVPVVGQFDLSNMSNRFATEPPLNTWTWWTCESMLRHWNYFRSEDGGCMWLKCQNQISLMPEEIAHSCLGALVWPQPPSDEHETWNCKP